MRKYFISRGALLNFELAGLWEGQDSEFSVWTTWTVCPFLLRYYFCHCGTVVLGRRVPERQIIKNKWWRPERRCLHNTESSKESGKWASKRCRLHRPREGRGWLRHWSQKDSELVGGGGKAGVLPGKLLLRTEDWAWAVEQGSGKPERCHLKHFV